jgi:hypothetical protein
MTDQDIKNILKPKLRPLTIHESRSTHKKSSKPFGSQLLNSLRNRRRAYNPKKLTRKSSKSAYHTPKKSAALTQTIDAYLKPAYKKSEVTHLNLSRCSKLTGQTLDLIIENCPKIECLVLTHIKEIADDLTKFKEMRKLEALRLLNLACTGVSDSKLRLLIDNLPGLKKLSLQCK